MITGFRKWTLTTAALLSFGLMAHAQTMQQPMNNRQSGSATGAPAATSTTAAGSTATAAPNDAQIAHIVVTANQLDIDGGKMALSNAESKEVKDFAKLMVTDHTAVNVKATALAKKLKMTPEDNSTSQALKKSAANATAHLKTVKGADFDKAYIANEVTVHQQVLDALDKTLIPNAKDTELKALLEKTRPTIQAHLEHAQKLQASMSK